MPEKETETPDMTVHEEKPVHLAESQRGEIPQDKTTELWMFHGKTVKPGWFVDF